MAKDINKLKRERSAKVIELRELLALVETRADKKFTTEEETRVNALQLDIEKRTLEISEEQRSQDEEKGTSRAQGTFGAPENRASNVPQSKRFKSLFPNAVGGDHGFRSTEEFFEILASGRFDERMQSRAAAAGVGSLGGYSVPTSTAEILWDRALENSIVRPRAQVWGMETTERTVPSFQSQDTSSSVFGFVGQWLGELSEGNVQDPQLRAIKLVAKKLAIFSAMSREIAQDGLGFGAQLELAMVKAITHFQDLAFINGSGTGEPLGALNSPCTIEVNRTGAAAVAWADLVAMYSRLLPGSAQNAVWLINQSALPALLTMVDPGGSLIWKAGEPLLGAPVVITEKVPTLGGRGDVSLLDFSCYCIGNRAEIAVDITNAFKWTNDRMDIRAIIRVDGQSVFSQPVKNASGLETSPFVVLK